MSGRKLTASEIELAKIVFKDQLDYDKIKIHNKKFIFFQPDNSGMAPNGDIYIVGCCYSDDYGKADNGAKKFFIHEMTHVWQKQNKILDPILEAVKEQIKHKFNYAQAYCYKIEGEQDFLSFGMEQQASIVEEYYALKCNDFKPSTRASFNKSCSSKPSMIRLYEEILKPIGLDIKNKPPEASASYKKLYKF